MNKIIVSVSATSDLTKELQEEYGIAVAPMEYMLDGEIHSTAGGVNLEEFYEAMRKGAITKTSQINREEARAHLESLLSSGADVLHIEISSGLSGTYDNFVAAANELNEKYPNKARIVDGLGASHMLTMIALACVDEIKKGKTLNEVGDYADELSHNVSALFTVDSLTYLARLGRVSKGAALLGNAIHLKVAMRVNDEGKLVPYKKVLSRKKAMNQLLASMQKMYVPKVDRIMVGHAVCEDDARYLAENIKKTYGVDVPIYPLGPVIGSHSGPGTLAIFFTTDGRDIKD